MKPSIRSAALLATWALAATVPAQAVTTQVFSDLAAFQSATAATSATGALPLPLPGGLGSISGAQNSTVVGTVTFVAPSWYFTNWSTLLPGAEIAISNGAGNTQVPNGFYNDGIDAGFAAPVYAAGFDFHQPTASTVIDGCNVSPCVDSQFQVTLKSGATVVASFAWTPLKDQRDFFGVWSNTPFNTLEIRETVGTDDNEFYGQFYTGTAPVPEPGTAALWLAGLLALGVARRRAC